mgnify:CR=1 FL=1
MPRTSEMNDDGNTVTSLAPTRESLQIEATTWAGKVSVLTIIDRESCVNASHFLRSIKGLRAQIQQWFEPHIEAAMETKRKADAARKALVDERDRIEAPLVDAETRVKRALLTWETEQENIRREQERQLQAEAQRQAEAMTLAAAAEMELKATATGDAGLLQEAQDILDQPIKAPVVSVAKLIPKVQGVTYRDHWKVHQDIDVKALAAAVGASLAPATFVLPNLPALNSFARATQGTQAVPGLKFWNDREIAARQ